jgi:hypothetical protein
MTLKYFLWNFKQIKQNHFAPYLDDSPEIGQGFSRRKRENLRTCLRLMASRKSLFLGINLKMFNNFSMLYLNLLTFRDFSRSRQTFPKKATPTRLKSLAFDSTNAAAMSKRERTPSQLAFRHWRLGRKKGGTKRMGEI